MKVIALVMYLLLVVRSVLAQGNSFPSTGNASIGTSSAPDAIAAYNSIFFGYAGVLEGHGAASGVFLNCNGYRQTGGGYYYRQTAPYAGISLANGNISFETALSGNAGTAISKDAKMTISLNGNIGIGTTTPSNLLHVITSTVAAGVRAESSSTFGSIQLKATGGAVQDWMIGADLVGVTGGGLAFYNNATGNYRMVLTGNGNLGIGTASPSEKLAVNGNIKARQIIVTQNNWSDYVFEPNYKLQPLSVVEKYIIKYKHLPEVPSANEIQAGGLNIGDAQALLLKKLEELTLYVIEQQREINKLKRNRQQHHPQRTSQ